MLPYIYSRASSPRPVDNEIVNDFIRGAFHRERTSDPRGKVAKPRRKLKFGSI